MAVRCPPAGALSGSAPPETLVREYGAATFIFSKVIKDEEAAEKTLCVAQGHTNTAKPLCVKRRRENETSRHMFVARRPPLAPFPSLRVSGRPVFGCP